MTTTTSIRRGARLLRAATAVALVGVASLAGAAAPAAADDDLTPPLIEAGPWDTPAYDDVEDWFTGPATYHLHASDPSGVILSYVIYHGGVAQPAVSQSGDEGVSVFPVISEEGTSWIAYRAVDGHGNDTGAVILTVHVDSVAPTIDDVSPAEAVDGTASYALGAEVPLAATCHDDGSGSVCLDDDHQNLPAVLPTDTVGVHEYRIHAFDIVGHETVLTLRYEVYAPAPPESDPAGPAAPQAGPVSPVEGAGDPQELAFTGPEDSWPFALAAVALVVLGGLLVRRASRRGRATAGSVVSALTEGN